MDFIMLFGLSCIIIFGAACYLGWSDNKKMKEENRKLFK